MAIRDNPDLKQRRIVKVDGNCPRCGRDWLDEEEFFSLITGESFQGGLPEGSRLKCFQCGHIHVVGTGKKVYERRDHFTYQVKGKDNTNFAIAPALEERGYRLPKDFSGSSEQLAATLKMTHKELAKVWRMREDELRKLGDIRITH